MEKQAGTRLRCGSERSSWSSSGPGLTTEVRPPLKQLEQAPHSRPRRGPLVHHSDRGSQYLSLRYTERLAEAFIGRSVWRSFEDVEFATLEWVDWYNNRRLFEPLGYVPPREFEAAFFTRHEAPALGAGLR